MKNASLMAVGGVMGSNSNVSAKVNHTVGMHERDEQVAGVSQDNNRYSVCWIGNAGWLLRIGQVNILIDPDLQQNQARKTLEGIPEDCLSSADAVLITHEHGDHFNRSTNRRLVEESTCRFILPASCRHAAMQTGIPEKRIIAAHHFKPIELFGSRFIVTPIPAVHGDKLGAVFNRYNAADCGYLISAMGINLFHPGDTVLLQDHLEQLPTIDVLMVSPTEHNTNVLQSLTLIEKLNPRYIFPQHRDTYYETEDNYYWTHAYHMELAEALDERFKSRYHIVKQGQDFEIRT